MWRENLSAECGMDIVAGGLAKPPDGLVTYQRPLYNHH